MRGRGFGLWVVAAATGCEQLFAVDALHPRDAGAPDLAAGLVAYYPFDELGTPACAIDASGGGHDGTCTHGMPSLAPGKVGMAFELVAVPTVVEVPDAPGFDPTVGFSFAAWIMVESFPTPALCVINKPFGPAMADSYQLGLNTDQLFASMGTPFRVPMTVTIGDWHHYAIAWDGTIVGVWFDGLLRAQAPITSVATDNHTFVLGADLDSGVPACPFQGRLDELRVYARGLTGEEIGLLAHP